MGSRLRGSNSDSEDLRIVQLIQEIEDDDSEVESAPSILRVRGYIPREREVAAQHLWDDYFSEMPKYPQRKFKLRFRMRIQLFLRIVQGITTFQSDNMPEYFTYFSQRVDAIGRPTFTTLQKCTSAIRQLAYGTAPDMWDEYLQMSEQTSILCLDYFCMCIITLYKREYMRSPNEYDVARLYSAYKERHGFRGMLGSIDFTHWEWRNCPVALKGQYTKGDHKKPTLMLEANGTFSSAPFGVNGHEYRKGYYLADGIYPDWATLVKGYSCPTEEPTIKVTRFQASARKDIEIAFGVLQGRFHIIRIASRSMSVNRMRRVVECCLILHNMILEDNGFALSKWEERFTTEEMENGMERIRNRGRDRDIIAREIRDRDMHNQLTEDLVERIWNLPPTFRNAN
ncbi:uncharacterized protein [Rutidosis leptorrhynchoides]|uniref:uncharacterized protein n=1 Tax=Rutidosis leptorrhynchoides TaxID=125765 RepID=UPI003A99A790